jgi:hypothetical protein
MHIVHGNGGKTRKWITVFGPGGYGATSASI